ncbi:MAG: 6-bladed beta-propeller [Sedimentisphaerales bacterium]
MDNSQPYKSLVFIGIACSCLLLYGCQSAVEKEQIIEPVFFPKPPDKPRLQFLKSFSRPEDLGAKGPSAFERFIIGEPEIKQGIARPYGIAIYDGKMYVCDVGKRMVEVLDPENHTFTYLTKDRRLINPVNIYIDQDGVKYIADPTAGAVFVFDKSNNLSIILGKELKIAPIDVVVRGRRCYVTDFNSNQVIVLDKTTGKEIARVGQEGDGEAQFKLISDLALDREGNIYVTDKAKGKIVKFNNSGVFERTIGRLGDNIDEFVRPKGIAIDKRGNIWVVDAATEVVKIYNPAGQLLLFFGLPGNKPGMMNLPAKVILDYDNVELFRKNAVEGANLEFLVLVSNQYGLNKINVYGFGNFPMQEKTVAEAKEFALASDSKSELAPDISESFAKKKVQSQKMESQQQQQKRDIVEVYYRSMAFYRAGQLKEARQGFIIVLKSGLIPPAMAKTLQSYLTDIDNTLNKGRRQEEIAEIYYRSMAFYRAGQLEKAREGFVEVLTSGLIPRAMAKTIEGYLMDINDTLATRSNIRP